MNRQELSSILREHRSKNGVLIKRICAQMDAGANIVNRIERALYNYNCNTLLSYMNAIGVAAKVVYKGSEKYINSPDEIIELVKSIRSKEKLSQREFADKIGVSNVTVANVERGFSRMKIDLLILIINTFGYELQIIDKGSIKEQDDGEIHTS